jgi:hypothetical protein
MILHRAVLVFAIVLAGSAATGCAAVYPELGTRTRSIPAGQPLDPPPPDDVRWIKFLSAQVPDKTRDGRPWRANGKASPYAKMMKNGVELFKTVPQADTLTPTWPAGPRGNFHVAATDRLRVELWDSNPLDDKPIGSRELGTAEGISAADGKLVVDLDNGAELTLAFQPAHAVSGLGLWFELHTPGCAITRLLEGSPAERAGLLAHDEVLKMGNRDVSTMTPDEIRSAFNAVPLDGLSLTVKHAKDNSTTEVTLHEGPIYPTFEQFGPVD